MTAFAVFGRLLTSPSSCFGPDRLIGRAPRTTYSRSDPRDSITPSVKEKGQADPDRLCDAMLLPRS